MVLKHRNKRNGRKRARAPVVPTRPLMTTCGVAWIFENDGVPCVMGEDNLENEGVTRVFGTCSSEVWGEGYTRPGAFLLLQPFLLLRCLE